MLTFFASPIIGRLADRHGKLTVYRYVAPASIVMMLLITHLPPVRTSLAVAAFGMMMVCNVGRMIPAMAMVTSSVTPRRRGPFMSANSSVQHIACGIGAYIGGLIISETSTHRIEHFGTVGWIAAATTVASLWLAGRIEIVTDGPSAEELSLAAAAEAEVNAGEALASCEAR